MQYWQPSSEACPPSSRLQDAFSAAIRVLTMLSFSATVVSHGDTDLLIRIVSGKLATPTKLYEEDLGSPDVRSES